MSHDGSSRPNLLYLTHRVPHPPNRGDRIRTFHLMRHLSHRYRIHLACLAEEEPSEEDLSVLRELCAELAVVRVPPRLRWLHASVNLATGGSATEGLFRSSKLSRIVDDWAASVRFAGVLAFCSSMFQYADSPALRNLPKIVDLIDVDSQKWFDYAEQSAGFKSWLYKLEGRRVRRLESLLARRASAIMLVSQSEVEVFESFASHENVYELRNGVDFDYFQPNSVETDSNLICFVGRMDYFPNQQAMCGFCEQVLPIIRAERPAVQLQIVGANPSSRVLGLAEQPGVSVTGTVSDIRPYVRRSAMMVVPLRIARGTQNKILESMAMGVPVVCSRESLRGLDVAPGKHVLTATTPAEYRDTILRLMDHDEERAQLARVAREYVLENFRWDTQCQKLDLLIDAHVPLATDANST